MHPLVMPVLSTIDLCSRNLTEALDDAQSAKNRGDEQALGYAEGRVLHWKREIAKLDPNGYGHQYAGLLTNGERLAAGGK